MIDTAKKIIEVVIGNMLELPLAYDMAIRRANEVDGVPDYDRDVCGGEITLLKIKFEGNSRNKYYTCVFEVSRG